LPRKKDPAVRAVLLDAHVYLAEAHPLKNLHWQENRSRRQYAYDTKELGWLREACGKPQWLRICK